MSRGGSAFISRVRICELGPADGDVVDAVFAGLSPHSRYLRFHGTITELSPATRRSLTALDGRTHVALAAFAQGRPIGIVRILDLGDERAELAVEVVDRWQGCGVGTKLLQAARDRASELGYRELVGEMLTANAAVHTALRRVFRVTAGAPPWFGADDNHGRRRRAGAGEPRAGTRRVETPTDESPPARPPRPRHRGGWYYSPSAV